MTSAAPITTAQARRRDAAATRDALLAAGAELFAERGYDGVPVTAIAQKAGVNKAMINYHFGGKRKLYLAIVSATFPEIIDKPARILGAVQRIVARGVGDGDFRPVDTLLTHLSLVGSLVFFFATARFRERVLAMRRPAIKPPDAAAYVKHIQDLLTYGLAADSTRGRRRG